MAEEGEAAGRQSLGNIDGEGRRRTGGGGKRMCVRACVCWPQLEARSAREEAPTAEPLVNRLLFILLADHLFFRSASVPTSFRGLASRLSVSLRFMTIHFDTLN